MKNVFACCGQILLLTVILMPFSLTGQVTLKGKCIDENSKTNIPGVVIRIIDSYHQTLSDADGNFSLNVTGEEKILLTVSHIAYKKDTFSITSGSSPLTIQLKPKTYISQEFTVLATRVTDNSAIAHTNVTSEDLDRINFGQDLPYLLRHTPSLVMTSDAGTGIGYSALRIRGSDATRVNVTINGIPVNDAESHQVYWVDLPDLASATDNLQIQRGIGTSSNGAGAFGGSVNIQTLQVSSDPYASINSSAGSFNTFKNTVAFGSGILADHFSLDGRLSMIKSDGYIDRASSDLRSFFMSGIYTGSKHSVKVLIMSGKERTHQAWYGVPQDSLSSNRTFNPAGMYLGENGSVKFYDAQTDNYQQDNYQMHYTRVINSTVNVNLAIHATKGKGYYEEYSAGDAFSDYFLEDAIVATDTITHSDFIRQRWLDNLFYGSTLSINYSKGKTKVNLGSAVNRYEGKHFGELIWSKDKAIESVPYRYYDDDALKSEIGMFAKISHSLSGKLNVFGDLQWRSIDYSFEGRENGGAFKPQSVAYSFFNPKVGVNFKPGKSHELYIFAGVGQKEPVRDDFIDSSPNSRPKPERMTDYEAGYRTQRKQFRLGLNFYFMDYYDQLILNGEINDVGEYTRQNVDRSYRTGVELEAGWMISKDLTLEGNLTLSKNKIHEYEDYLDDYDSGTQIMRRFSSTDIAFSPSVTGAAILSWKAMSALTIDFSGKYVGKQYLDNTMNSSRQIESYIVNDLLFRYSLQFKNVRQIGLSLQVNNLFDVKYSANGYTYSYIYGGENSTFNYFYPQAGRNFMAGIKLLF